MRLKFTFIYYTIFCSLIFIGSGFSQSLELWNEQAALRLFVKRAPQWGVSSTYSNTAKISSFYKSQKQSIYHAYIQQYVKGLPVLNAVFALHTASDGKVLHTTNNFSALSEDSFVLKSHYFTAENAITQVKKYFPNSVIPQKISFHTPAQKTIYSETEIHIAEIAFEQKNHWYKGYFISWFDYLSSKWYNVVINAFDGSLVQQFSWTHECFHKEHSHSLTAIALPSVGKLNRRNGNDSNNFAGYSAVYHSFDFPVESPIHGSTALHVHPWDSLASPYGWHDLDGVPGVDYTITRGNNVHASEDHDYDNMPGYAPNGDSALAFDFPYTLGDNDPLNYLDFSITQLFFSNNRLHDILYHYGFDEPSGNFQYNNYGRGGYETDHVRADAQDGSNTNNANFSSPPDGSPPRMQMFIWEKNNGVSRFRINAPINISGNIAFVVAQFGARPGIPSIRGKLIWVNDSSANPTVGCNKLINEDLLKDNLALIDRGSCNFVTQVYQAQLAGAKAAIVVNNVSGSPFAMSGTNNNITIPAIMISKEDGEKLRSWVHNGGVMAELYDSSAASKKFDSDLDIGVIIHEYIHGLSNRLTCGPNISNGLNHAEQMGEGWSDFFALAFTAKSDDVGTQARGIGTYVNGQSKSSRGIRNYYYSTNMAVNPLTYATLETISQNGYPGPHYIGEIWCSMLWDLFWDLVVEYGFDNNLKQGTGGNNIALQLVVEGMKLQKCNPGFVDARDGILKADTLFHGGKYSNIIWKSFARRGLGANAHQGSVNSVLDGIAGYLTYEEWQKIGLPDSELKSFSIYPNPVKQKLHIVSQTRQPIEQVWITDISGKVFSISWNNETAGAIEADVSNLTQGMYVLTFVSNGNRHHSQFLKIP